MGIRSCLVGLGLPARVASLRNMRTLILLVGLLSLGLTQVLTVAAAEQLPPGHHRRQAFGDGWTFDVLVPQAATTTPTLPVLFLFKFNAAWRWLGALS